MAPRYLALSRTVLGLATLLAMSVGAATARAATKTPFYGVRSLSMGGAHRGLTGSNDAVFINQAAMAMERRYSAEGQYVTGGDHVSRGLISTVDAKTAAVAAGVAYCRIWGNPSGEHPGLNQFNMALGYAPLSMLSFGLGAVNVHGHYNEHGRQLQLSHFNATLSAMLSLAQIIGVGVTWENFIPVGKAGALTPRGLGLGAGVRTGLFRLGADMRFDLAHTPHMPRAVDVGGELTLLQFLALRGGWRLVPDAAGQTPGRNNVVTAGLAAMLGNGGLEVGMEKALVGHDWRMAVGLQFLM